MAFGSWMTGALRTAYSKEHGFHQDAPEDTHRGKTWDRERVIVLCMIYGYGKGQLCL